MQKRTILTSFTILLSFGMLYSWGFFAHKEINKLAIFSLPREMISFYKHHLDFIYENAVNPDKRRYAVEGEAARHYIDLEAYGDDYMKAIPKNWQEAVEKYSRDSLNKFGIVPWHIYRLKLSLTKAFKEHDMESILRLSTEIGHYIADANVPLHTTVNYNGQLTGQDGIHAFWESRLPELYFNNYDLFVVKANYLSDPLGEAWNAVFEAHKLVSELLQAERSVSKEIPEDKKFSYEERGNQTVKLPSKKYAKAYYKALDGMVEKQMRASIKMIADFWYTCWIDAGQPDLHDLVDRHLSRKAKEKLAEEKRGWEEKKFSARSH